jgi:organic hydroperoxide reductase OsmC/OhrA
METEKFKLNITQTPDDLLPIDRTKRVCTAKFTVNKELPQMKIQIPLNYGGPKIAENLEKYYTPEHLFLSAISSCFVTTFLVVSKNSNLDYINISVDSDTVIDIVNERKTISQINQNIILTIPKGVSEKKALKVLKLTANYCILGNSIKSKVSNIFNVSVA